MLIRMHAGIEKSAQLSLCREEMPVTEYADPIATVLKEIPMALVHR